MKVKLFDPISNQNEEKELIEILRSGFWASGTGTGKVSKFEQEFKKYTKTKSCVAVNS
jgi:perosamine synthetase